MKPSMREITRATAAYFGLTFDEMRAVNRAQKFSWPRQIAMVLCRELSGRSTPDIGQFFGGRDHTTVLHAIHAVAAEMAIDDKSFRAMMAIAAEASGLSIDRQRKEREWAQELHRGQPLVALAPVEPIPPPPCRVLVVPPTAPARRVLVAGDRWSNPRPRPPVMPSELAAPALARLMGARA